MNNFYHKIAVAYVGIALGFVLGATKGAKAATFTLASTTSAQIVDSGTYDGLGDQIFPPSIDGDFMVVLRGPLGELAQLNEFNIGSFSFVPNTVITKAILQVKILTLSSIGLGIDTPINPGSLGIFGYVGNGTVEVSDFEAGVFLSSVDVSSSFPSKILNFDVTPFINQRVSNGDAFAGFSIRALGVGGLGLNNPDSSGQPRLIVETTDVAEPVPEPTTIFGSVIALGVGGLLKRKKSSQPNKTKSQG